MRGLLRYLVGPGHDGEHRDPPLVAGERAPLRTCARTRRGDLLRERVARLLPSATAAWLVEDSDMRGVLVVLTLASVVMACGGAAVGPTDPLVTLSVTGGRTLCSIDGHRAQPCSRRYKLRRGQTLTVRARTGRRGHSAHAAEARIAITFTDGRALCSVDRHRARRCSRRYRLKAGQTLTVRARAPTTGRRRPPGNAASSGPFSPTTAQPPGATPPAANFGNTRVLDGPYGSSTISQVGLATNIGALYGTFQSHSQRVAYVSGGGGIFVAYLGYAGPSHDTACHISAPQPSNGLTDGCQSYAIVDVDRSTDGGSTFSHVLQIGIGGHYPPSLEINSAGDVIVVVNDAGNTDGAWVYKLPAGNWNSPHLMGMLTYGYDDKFSTGYDPGGQSASSGGTYWEMHGGDGPTNNHYVMITNRAAAGGWGGGAVNTQCTSGSQQNCYFWLADTDTGALAPSGGVFAHYPYIYFDRSGSCRSGQTGPCDLAVMAWTTTDQSCSAYGYYDIHYLISPDGGATWYGKNGAISYASFPILAGDDGPGWQLLDSSEYNSDGNTCTNDANWLANVYIQDGHLFFIYRHQGSNALYRRVTPTWTGSGYTMTNDVGPITVGVGDGNEGAFFSGYGTAGSRIFLTGATHRGNGITTVSSTNDGQTWSTYATGPTTSTYVYATSGAHELGPGGTIIGAFTNQIGANGANSSVYFIHNP